jgi:hypothetical protein
VLIAVEDVKDGPGDERRDFASILGPDDWVVLVGKDQRRDGDACECQADVVASHLVEQHHRHVGRGRGALEATEPAKVAPTGVRDEHCAQRQRPEMPVAAQQRGEGLVSLRCRHARTAGVGGVEDEAVHSLWMAGRERGGRRATPRIADQAAPLDVCGVEHCLELVDVVFDRRREAGAVGQTASKSVVPDETMGPGELGACTCRGGMRPQLLDVRQPTRQHDQRPTRAGLGVSHPMTAGRLAELDARGGHDRHRGRSATGDTHLATSQMKELGAVGVMGLGSDAQFCTIGRGTVRPSHLREQFGPWMNPRMSPAPA